MFTFDSTQQKGFVGHLLVVVVVVIALIYAIGAIAYQNFLAKQAAVTANKQVTAKGDAYLAVGDSYSAGWGADRTPANLTIDKSSYDTSNKCLRNKNSAQYIVARDLGFILTDATCGGAVTSTLLTDKQLDNPPQLDALSPDTKLVTMTIGGNDTALLYALNCIQTSDCANNTVMTMLINLRIADLPTNLNKIYKQIIAKAPHAKIRHAGYPYIIPPPGESTGTCQAWLTNDEEKAFNDLLVSTNDKIKQTINTFATETGADAQYVDPLASDSPFMQRDSGQLLDGCSTSMKRYMNGPNDGTDGGWHPNIYGQQAYAAIYKKTLK